MNIPAADRARVFRTARKPSAVVLPWWFTPFLIGLASFGAGSLTAVAVRTQRPVAVVGGR